MSFGSAAIVVIVGIVLFFEAYNYEEEDDGRRVLHRREDSSRRRAVLPRTSHPWFPPALEPLNHSVVQRFDEPSGAQPTSSFSSPAALSSLVYTRHGNERVEEIRKKGGGKMKEKRKSGKRREKRERTTEPVRGQVIARRWKGLSDSGIVVRR